MRLLGIALLLVVVVSSARAQEYTAPEADLWRQMVEALANVPMTLPAHQQVQRILADVQREATIRAARAKAADAKKD